MGIKLASPYTIIYAHPMGFPGDSVVKSLPASEGDIGSIPGLGRSLEKEMATHSVFLPGGFYGQRSLVGYSPRGRKESDTTEHRKLRISLSPAAEEFKRAEAAREGRAAEKELLKSEEKAF